jgi:hypothetical protein
VIAAGLAGPAFAQPMLYEQRLPEGTGFVRLVNATGGQITVKPDYDEATTLGTNGAERVSPFYVSEGIAGRPVRLQVTAGGRTVPVDVRLQGSALNIVVIRGSGERIGADAFQVRQLYEQQRAVLAFVNAVPDCPNGTVALAGGQAVIQGVAPMSAQNRAVAPAAAVLRASCGNQAAPNLDLGRLQAGGLYSVWLMAPEGQPVSFVARDTIARR